MTGFCLRPVARTAHRWWEGKPRTVLLFLRAHLGVIKSQKLLTQKTYFHTTLETNPKQRIVKRIRTVLIRYSKCVHIDKMHKFHYAHERRRPRRRRST